MPSPWKPYACHACQAHIAKAHQPSKVGRGHAETPMHSTHTDYKMLSNRILTAGRVLADGFFTNCCNLSQLVHPKPTVTKASTHKHIIRNITPHNT